MGGRIISYCGGCGGEVHDGSRCSDCTRRGLRELTRISEEVGGYDAEASFTKHDTAKPDLALLPLSAMEAWAAVLTYGEKKYSRNNWRNSTAADELRLRNALLRHVLQYSESIETGGDGLDEESGLSHLAHAMANLGFLIDLAKRSAK